MIKEILDVARGELGYKEGNNNNTKYGADYGLNYNPWCQMFIWWIAQKAGISENIIPKTASCPRTYQWFKEKGQVVPTKEVKAGDIIFFTWNRSKNADHVGIVEAVNSNIITTIEGNFNNMVARRTINKDNSCIFAICRPAYVESENTYIPEVVTKVKYVNTTSGLNMRESPTTNSKIIQAIPYKKEVAVRTENVGSCNGFNWDFIQYNNKVGYVANKYLSKISANTVTSKSVDELAKEVIKGLWGNGADRKNRLTNAGYDYNAVQRKVNQLLK